MSCATHTLFFHLFFRVGVPFLNFTGHSAVNLRQASDLFVTVSWKCVNRDRENRARGSKLWAEVKTSVWGEVGRHTLTSAGHEDRKPSCTDSSVSHSLSKSLLSSFFFIFLDCTLREDFWWLQFDSGVYKDAGITSSLANPGNCFRFNTLYSFIDSRGHRKGSQSPVVNMRGAAYHPRLCTLGQAHVCNQGHQGCGVDRAYWLSFGEQILVHIICYLRALDYFLVS